jgi:colanic acid biosynthesis protein WcaH
VDAARFLEVVDRTPLVSIDLVVVDPNQRVLCGRRVNQPARGYWFVPGGRIRKDELLDDAFERIASVELGGGPWLRADASLLGVFDHLYDTNFADAPDITTHYVVLAHRIDVEVRVDPPEDQHSEYRWLSEVDARSGDALVHRNTLEYFKYL